VSNWNTTCDLSLSQIQVNAVTLDKQSGAIKVYNDLLKSSAGIQLQDSSQAVVGVWIRFRNVELNLVEQARGVSSCIVDQFRGRATCNQNNLLNLADRLISEQKLSKSEFADAISRENARSLKFDTLDNDDHKKKKPTNPPPVVTAAPPPPATAAPVVPTQPVTAAPVVPTQPVTKAPVVPTQPVTKAPVVPTQPVTKAPVVPTQPVTKAPVVPTTPVQTTAAPVVVPVQTTAAPAATAAVPTVPAPAATTGGIAVNANNNPANNMNGNAAATGMTDPAIIGLSVGISLAVIGLVAGFFIYRYKSNNSDNSELQRNLL
jgi:hypothetical protein